MNFSEYLTNLSSIISEVFNETEQLNKFRPTIFIKGTPAKYGSYYRMEFNDATSNLHRSNYAVDMGIHIVPFNLNMESLRINYQSSIWTSLMSPGYQIKHIASGINLNKNIKTKGSLMNARSVLTARISNYDRNIVAEWYYMGKSNVVLAMLTTNNSLFIRTQSLINAIINSDRNNVKLVLMRLFLMYDKILSESIDSILFRYEDINNLTLHHRRLYNHTILSASERKRYISESDQLVSLLNTVVDQYYKQTQFGINSDYSYSILVKELFKSQQSIIKKERKKSFNEGMAFGQKILDCGWIKTNKKIHSFTGTVWSKQVNIIPETFIYDNKRYLIPEDKRYWKLTTLYLLSDSSLYCMEEHPNISDTGKVCTGTLEINLYAATEALKVLLDDIESLLEVINFDSPHRRNHLKELLECSEIIEVLSKDFKKVNYEIITADLDISLIDDEEEEEEEEEIIAQIKGNADGTTIILENDTNVTDTRNVVRSAESAISFAETAFSTDGNERIESHYNAMSIVHNDLLSTPVSISLPDDSNGPTLEEPSFSFRLAPENIL